MLHEKLEPGLTSDKLIKRIKRKWDSVKMSKVLRDLRWYIKGSQRRSIEKERSKLRQAMRNKEQ